MSTAGAEGKGYGEIAVHLPECFNCEHWFIFAHMLLND